MLKKNVTPPIEQAVNLLLSSCGTSLKELTSIKGNPGQLLNVREAANRLKVSVPTIYRMIRQGKLSAIKISDGCTRISEAQIVELSLGVER